MSEHCKFIIQMSYLSSPSFRSLLAAFWGSHLWMHSTFTVYYGKIKFFLSSYDIPHFHYSSLAHLTDAPAKSLRCLRISHCREITKDVLEKLVRSCPK